MKGRRAIGAGVAAALAASLAAGCSDSGGGGTGTSSGRSVLTGEPGSAGRVLAVKVDNVGQGRPQTGLNQADLVYAIQVEGGLSRLMAVYDSNHLPPVVGPVRSARETDLELLAEYNRPALAYSGAQRELLTVIKKSREIVSRTGTDAFFRNPDRPAPHNEYLRTQGVADDAGEAEDIGLRFSATAPAGGTPDSSTTASMPAARFTFTWNGSRYRVALDGSVSPWTTDNVIIQQVRIEGSRFGSRTGSVPFSRTVGRGSGVVLRDGRSYEVRWSRATSDDGTTYTSNGRPMPLHPGRTWIVLAPR